MRGRSPDLFPLRGFARSRAPLPTPSCVRGFLSTQFLRSGETTERLRVVVPPPSSEQSRWFPAEVQPHEATLRAWLRSRFPSLPDLDDIVQESYARLLRARETGRVAYAKAFLFTTARNAALDLFRRRVTAGTDSIAEMEQLHVIEDAPSVPDAVSRQQELALLAEAIRNLPDRCRQVLTLRKLYGLSQKEIAARLGIAEHTVEVQVGKGMRRCADYFAERGLLKPGRSSTPPSSSRFARSDPGKAP